MAGGTLLLATEGLRMRWPRGSELHFADVQAAPGAVVRLHGPSGSGKSTLLALLAGLMVPTAGRVQVDGTDVCTLQPGERDRWRGRTLGLVPQRLHLSPALSVRDNCRLAWFAAGEPTDEARIEHVLVRLGLGKLADRRPRSLSVGQAQRAALARAVMRRPRLLLADEPTANLDDASAANALAVLVDCAAESGATLVVATHDARVAAALPKAQSWVLQGAPAGAAA